MARRVDIGTLGCFFFAAVIGTAAQDLIQPTAIAYVSSEFTAQERLAANTINGSGMSESPATVNSTHSTTNTDMWITGSANEVTAVIVFDLGSNQEITKTHVWNYNEISTEDKTARGVKAVDILYSSDASYESASFTSIGSFDFTQGGTSCQTVETPAEDVRFVKFDIKENWGYTQGFVGLSEVRFSGAEVGVRAPLSRAAAHGPADRCTLVMVAGNTLAAPKAGGAAAFTGVYNVRGALVRNLDGALKPSTGTNVGKGCYILKLAR